jgi:hypothetical protein
VGCDWEAPGAPAGCSPSGDLGDFMMQDHKLVIAQSQRGVSASRIITELDLKHSGRKGLDDRPDLAPAQRMLRDVFQ